MSRGIVRFKTNRGRKVRRKESHPNPSTALPTGDSRTKAQSASDQRTAEPTRPSGRPKRVHHRARSQKEVKKKRRSKPMEAGKRTKRVRKEWRDKDKRVR